MRCFDCLVELGTDDRFAVLKQMRDLSTEVPADEARALQWMLVDPVFVCRDCAPWYGDHAIPVTAEEAEA